MKTTMSEALDIAATSLSLIEDSSFQNQLAQIRAHAVMENLGVDSSRINWRYHRRGLERNGTAGVFSIEAAVRLDPTVLEERTDLTIAALRMAQLWEALAATSKSNSTALLTAAASYELAGFQANSATIAERLKALQSGWAVEPLVVDFLRRRSLSVVSKQIEYERTIPDVTDPVAFVTVAADRLLGRGLAAASHYLLSGQSNQLDTASELLGRGAAHVFARRANGGGQFLRHSGIVTARHRAANNLVPVGRFILLNQVAAIPQTTGERRCKKGNRCPFFGRTVAFSNPCPAIRPHINAREPRYPVANQRRQDSHC